MFYLFFPHFSRYLGRPRAEQTILVRPPFLRPELSDGQIAVKIMDNGIQAELKRTKVRRPWRCCPSSNLLKTLMMLLHM